MSEDQEQDNNNTKKGRPLEKFSKREIELVKILILCGRTQEEISKALKIDPKTFRRHFSNVVDTSNITMEGKLVQVMLEKALSGDISAIKYLLDRRFSDRWTLATNILNAPNVDNSKLSTDDKELIGRLVDFSIKTEDKKDDSDETSKSDDNKK